MARGIGISDNQYTSQLNITFTKDNFMINDSETIIIECVHNDGNQTILINQLMIIQEGKEHDMIINYLTRSYYFR